MIQTFLVISITHRALKQARTWNSGDWKPWTRKAQLSTLLKVSIVIIQLRGDSYIGELADEHTLGLGPK
jgi:hypothetical protein